jgi:hypothetical protein
MWRRAAACPLPNPFDPGDPAAAYCRGTAGPARRSLSSIDPGFPPPSGDEALNPYLRGGIIVACVAALFYLAIQLARGVAS